jgi:hypothetical protein
MKNYRWAAGIVAMLLFIVWIGAGCKKTPSNETSVVPEVVGLDLPVNVAANQDSFYLFRAQAAEGLAFDSAVCSVYSSNRALIATFALFDDGGFVSLWGPAYASTYSGDVVPHNGTFTRRVNVRLMLGSTAGNYSLSFIPYSGSNAGNSTTYDLFAQNVEACVISSTPLPDAFGECFGPIGVTVRVSKSEPDFVDTVRAVFGPVDNPLASQDLTASSGDTTWTMQFAPTFFRCAPTDPAGFPITYIVKTRFGMTCRYEASAATHYVNSRPTLDNCTLPDTLYRPASATDTTRFVVKVLLQDCEYLATRDFDSYSVHYDVSRDDTLHWSAPNPAFVLFDNSVAPDGHPFDGVWAGGLSLTKSETLLNNTYYFRYYATDCAQPAATSLYLLDSVRVIQPSALAKSSPRWTGSTSGFAVLP